VTHLDELGGNLLTSVQSFRLPEEYLAELAAGERVGGTNRRVA